MVKQLRGHHFTLAEANKDGNKNYYDTVNKTDFNYKGDPSKIKGSIA